MRVRDPRLWLGLVSASLVLGLFALDYEATSPGPLSPSHGALAPLEGQAGCAACHGGWLASLGETCLDCHEAIAGQLAESTGLHGAGIAGERGNAAARDCASCHVEHHGDQLPLAGAEAFALAGIPDREAFDHGHVPFELVGRHAELGCAGCHPLADSAVLVEGETRFLGLAQDCTSCHEDPHEGRFARGCASCHGQEKPFGELESFTHGEAFPLVGAHAGATCLECHPTDGDHEVEDLAGHGPVPPARTCQDCHASPHRPAFGAAVGRLLGSAPGDTCGACHDAADGSFAGEAARMPAELHAASGFVLTPPHDRARCADCHAEGWHPAVDLAARAPVEPAPPGAGAAFAARFPGRSQDDCGACHADPHGGQFDAEPYARAGCLACHERDAFRPHAFGVEEHARCDFPLSGSHGAVACSSCHLEPQAEGEPRLFRGTAHACSACHADVHAPTRAGEFSLAAERRDELGGCAACHTPERFTAVDSQAFEHGRWTGFELGGAHARASCASCHRRSEAPAADGRTLGRAEQRFPGPPDRCETCHADPHRGAFASATAAAAAAAPAAHTSVGCERCHTTEGFRAGEALESFDHGRWTSFALEGAHVRVACASCHGDPPPPAGDVLLSQRSFGFVSDRIGRDADTCAACHADPHRGRFDDDPGRPAGASCERCHSSESFSEVDRDAFDHGRWTGFALVGSHARAECSDCHAPSEQPAQGSVRLGPARGSDCAACHVDPHVGQFALHGRSDCAACHLPQADFHTLAFDHQRDSRFALDARHARLACAACHVPWPLRDGSQAVRYKPLGVECIDCHDPTGRRDGRAATGSTSGGGGGQR